MNKLGRLRALDITCLRLCLKAQLWRNYYARGNE